MNSLAMLISSLKGFVSLFCIAMVLVACDSKKLGMKEYLSACADTNQSIRVVKDMGEIKFKLQYLPTDLLVLQRGHKANRLSVKALDSLRAAYDTLQFYTLTIENGRGHTEPIGDQKDFQNYGQAIDYFSFHAQRDFSILQNGDTLPCILYHFERSYSLAPKNVISLAFKSKGKGDRVLMYNDRVFGLGQLNLGITQKDIDDFPKLEIE